MQQAEESGQTSLINAAPVFQIARVRPELLPEESLKALDERLKSM
jgi:hypothetical protein